MSVAVTGAGCISALGRGLEASLAALFAGDIQPLGTVTVDTSLDLKPAVFGVLDPVLLAGDERFTRTTGLALTAAVEALAQSWPGGCGVAPERLGVCFGTTVGSTFNEEPFYRAWLAEADPPADAITRYLANDLARAVAGQLGASGPTVTVANACASSADAIGMAMDWLESDRCDVVVAGGGDELARFAYLGFAALKNASPERCRPFDLERKGLNLGEAGAAVVLEREADARRRGARVLGRVLGYGAAADAHHMTAPHPEGRGLRAALAAALSQAGVAPRDIGLVNAHGTGTRENDRTEGRVLADLVSPDTPVLSTKGSTGHTLGAAGALEAVLTLGCLLHRRAPASPGFRVADPDCVLVPTTDDTRVVRPVAVSTSLAFGGTNAALVLGAEGW